MSYGGPYLLAHPLFQVGLDCRNNNAGVQCQENDNVRLQQFTERATKSQTLFEGIRRYTLISGSWETIAHRSPSTDHLSSVRTTRPSNDRSTRRTAEQASQSCGAAPAGFRAPNVHATDSDGTSRPCSAPLSPDPPTSGPRQAKASNLRLLEEKVHGLEYFDNLAMREPIQIVDTND